MCSEQTIFDVIKLQAEARPEQVAMVSQGYPSLTYSRLRSHIQRVVVQLRSRGLDRGDRIALVLRNGPAMATAFLAATARTTCAPLNPDYRAEEVDFYLSDLQAKLLIIQADLDSPAREVAKQKGIPVLELVPQPDEAAGLFQFAGEPEADKAPSLEEGAYAQVEEIALVLHTSGTTSRPKIVPLTHQHICTSVRTICQSLQLTERDRCLHMMPMFHIGGLIDLTLAPLAAGGTVIYTGGFSAADFWQQVAAHEPTWYQAVPTMLQELVDTTTVQKIAVDGHSLRLIRSVAAALPPSVQSAIADLFQIPVVETYGMTEAAPLITSTSLWSEAHKTGSVGTSVGPEIEIFDNAGKSLPMGETGEIAIRGDNVITAYENNPTANAKSFTAGWFLTGDLGYLDRDGHLYLQGRSKEIINRGGQKISPAEVDSVLLQHPDVYQAVTFALPHRSLGEEVAAAIILKAGADVTPADIVTFAAEHLAPYKVPRVIQFVADIPKGPTGKLQRIGLAERLNLIEDEQFIPPQTPLEAQLAKIWEVMMGVSDISVQDNFFYLGGSSLLAMRMLAEIKQTLGKELPIAALTKASTIRQLAQLIENQVQPLENQVATTPRSSLVEIQDGIKTQGHTQKSPLFLVAPGASTVLQYVELARCLGSDQPLYSLQAPELEHDDIVLDSIESIASFYLQEILTLKYEGPYLLGGRCGLGAAVAFEMACQLQAQGKRVPLLVMLDPTYEAFRNLKTKGQKQPGSLLGRLIFHWQRRQLLDGIIHKVPALEFLKFLRFAKVPPRSQSSQPTEDLSSELQGLTDPERIERLNQVFSSQRKALKQYVPKVYRGQVHLFLTDYRRRFGLIRYKGWESLATEGLNIQMFPGHHNNLLQQPNVERVAAKLTQHMESLSTKANTHSM
ncbi:MAG: AMP-binding protein [Cyanobacteria bacterium J06636_16]